MLGRLEVYHWQWYIIRLTLWCQKISYINILNDETLVLETSKCIFCLLARYLLINLKILLRPDLISSCYLWWKLVISTERTFLQFSQFRPWCGSWEYFVSKKAFWFHSQFIYICRHFLWLTKLVIGTFLIDSLIKRFTRIREFSKLSSEEDEIASQSVYTNKAIQ